MMWEYGMGWGGLLWLLVLGGLVAVLAAGIRPRQTFRRDALDLLEERFARGEIDNDTFQSMRSDLERTKR